MRRLTRSMTTSIVVALGVLAGICVSDAWGQVDADGWATVNSPTETTTVSGRSRHVMPWGATENWQTMSFSVPLVPVPVGLIDDAPISRWIDYQRYVVDDKGVFRTEDLVDVPPGLTDDAPIDGWISNEYGQDKSGASSEEPFNDGYIEWRREPLKFEFDDPVFTDGFESGDKLAWQTSTPADPAQGSPFVPVFPGLPRVSPVNPVSPVPLPSIPVLKPSIDGPIIRETDDGLKGLGTSSPIDPPVALVPGYRWTPQHAAPGNSLAPVTPETSPQSDESPIDLGPSLSDIDRMMMRGERVTDGILPRTSGPITVPLVPEGIGPGLSEFPASEAWLDSNGRLRFTPPQRFEGFQSSTGQDDDGPISFYWRDLTPDNPSLQFPNELNEFIEAREFTLQLPRGFEGLAETFEQQAEQPFLELGDLGVQGDRLGLPISPRRPFASPIAPFGVNNDPFALNGITGMSNLGAAPIGLPGGGLPGGGLPGGGLPGGGLPGGGLPGGGDAIGGFRP